MQPGSQREIQILHVDDDPSITDLTATFLEREDHRFSVETAASADEGLQLLAGSEIDCIISDYDMPGMNGIEFLESITKEYPDLPFILYTGKGSEEIASEAIRAGVTDYLQKESGPDHYSLLANRIQHAINNQRRKQRIQFFETIETELTELSIDFLRSEGADIDTLINRTLEKIGTIVNADRTHIFEINNKTETLTYEWCSEDLEPQMDMLQGIPQDTQPWWTQKLENFETITIPNVSELPPEAEAVQELLQEQNVASLIATPMISDGEVIGFIGFHWVEEQEPWSDEFINILRMVGELIVTARQRKQHQQELEKSDTIIGALTDAVYVIDEEGQFIYINDEFVELVGYNRERILGSTPSLIKDEEAVEQAEHHLGQLLSSDGPKTLNFEVTIRPRSGNPVVCEDHMGVLPYDGEEFNGSVGTLRDVTGRKERKQELEEVDDQYETLINNFPDGAVYLIDTDLRYVRAGGKELRRVGLSPDKIEGTKSHTLFPEEIADELCHYYEEALDENPNTFEQEYMGERYRIQTVPVRTDSEEVKYAMAVSQNVSERVEDKRKLERQNERLEEFTSIVSHDLKNPLQVAQGRLELAQTECDSAHLDDVADALDRSQALIDDLLTLAREGDLIGGTEPVSVSALAEKCWKDVPDKAATLAVETNRTVLADRSRLKQLLENLLGNAVKHGGKNVTVRVGDISNGFYIEDNGVGIPATEREDIFEAGYSTAEDGTGFGLRIVKQIVDAHGWNIQVTEGDDDGARIEVTDVDIPE